MRASLPLISVNKQLVDTLLTQQKHTRLVRKVYRFLANAEVVSAIGCPLGYSQTYALRLSATRIT